IVYISTLRCPPTLSPLHSFPTRRSSDLHLYLLVNRTSDIFSLVHASSERTAFNRRFHKPGHPILTVQTSSENDMPRWGVLQQTRSEEHTSELQSRFDLVCRLLLEKKKRK